MPLSDGSKAQELFAYLLLKARHPHTREAVASVLWDRCTTTTSKAYLRKALWQLRSALDKCEKISPPLLQLDPEWIQMRPGHAVWADVMVFEQAYRSGRGVDGAQLDDATAQAMQEGVQLYRGGLLPNRYERWCLEERERYGNMYLVMRDQLMDYHMSRMRFDEALEHGAEILRCDSSHERTHLRLMGLHRLRRDRTSALRQYRLCKAALEADLGVEPSEETTELYKRIRDEPAPSGRLRGPAADATIYPADAALRQLQSRLRELQSSFADLEKRAESLVMDLEK